MRLLFISIHLSVQSPILLFYDFASRTSFPLPLVPSVSYLFNTSSCSLSLPYSLSLLWSHINARRASTHISHCPGCVPTKTRYCPPHYWGRMAQQNKNTMIPSKRKCNRTPRASCSSLRTPTDGAASRRYGGKEGTERRDAAGGICGEESARWRGITRGRWRWERLEMRREGVMKR